MALTPTTWNPSDKGSACTLSNGNLTATGLLTAGWARSTFGASSGKYYWEITSTGSRYPYIGVATASASMGADLGVTAGSWAWYGIAGTKYLLNVGTTYGTTWKSPSQVIGFALDMDAGTLELYINGVAQGVMYSGITGTIYAVTGGDTNSATANATANFGATAFAYTPPAGFAAGFGPALSVLTGNVKDATGTNAARLVRAYREDTGALVGQATSNASTGMYEIASTGTPHTLVFYPAVGETTLPALVLRGVMPV